MKALIIRVLLGALNSRWLNATPCRYGFIGNTEAFDIAHLRYEVRARPDLTVAQLILEAERFAACPISIKGVTVMEADGSAHEATTGDLHELRQSLLPKRPA